MTHNYKTEKEFALKMNSEDSLKDYRSKFHIPKQKNGEEILYFCGNSLGLQPKSVRAHIEQELKDWENLGVEGHFEAKNPWMPYHEFLTEKMAKVVGAKPSEVVVMNTLTVNLHLMMVSFYRPTPKRHKIVIESNAFPSDQYAVKSQLNFHGYDAKDSLIELQPREGEVTIRTEDIQALLNEQGEEIALIIIGGVNYYTGQAFDMKAITTMGHEKGCLVGFDLAHGAGNLELQLHDYNADFAVWCTYKYLNSGPGGISGCFINERHIADKTLPRFAGWWGHNKATRFLMGPDFNPIETAEGWQISNAPVLLMASLKASLELFDEIGMKKLNEKSRKLTGYLEFLLTELKNDRIELITPVKEKDRGCQLSIKESFAS